MIFSQGAYQTTNTFSGESGIFYDEPSKKAVRTGHLGNVLVTVSDRKNPNFSGIAYNAQVLSANDYYPFGMVMPNPKNKTSGHRYAFNGQEIENEITKGVYTASFWKYDSRIGRRFNLDPYIRDNFTGYGVLANNPILYIDKNGDDWFLYSKKFLGFKYAHKIVWVQGDAVIYDPSAHSYSYLGPSLEYRHVSILATKKHGLAGGQIVMAPINSYIIALYLDGVWDKRLEDGYGDFGSEVQGSTIKDLHPTVDASYGTNMSKIFVANNNVTTENFYAVIMNSFLNGGGPENFYFGEGHEVSESFANSNIVRNAIEMFEDLQDNSQQAKDLRAGKFTEMENGESQIFNTVKRGIDEHGTALSPEHLVGNAEVRITLSPDGKNYNITIWNSTSVGSGTLGMDRFRRHNENDQLTNVSQTFELTVPVDSGTSSEGN